MLVETRDSDSVNPPQSQYSLPILSRPAKTWQQTLNGILFFVVFNGVGFTIHVAQFLLLFFVLPFKFLRVPGLGWATWIYDEGIRFTKGSLGTLLILVSQWFAPTYMKVTFETEGQGRFPVEEIEKVIVRNEKGEVVALDLPRKSILIANHQVYVDWWYAWCLAYFMGTHKDIYIVIKRSMKWVPCIGWFMQFFRFIFLRKSWDSDREQLSSHLSSIARKSEIEDKPMTLILYPEGTLVSKLTRPVSKKFADKMGIPDMVHTLLPRSTGLHYSLRSLAPRVPSLRLIDMTMLYPGVPPMGYGQSYYTMRSVFLDRVPPPAVHIHLRIFDVARDVPIGNTTIAPPEGPSIDEVDLDFPENERTAFELWLRALWREKDATITRFHETGSLSMGNSVTVEIPLRVRRRRDALPALGFMIVGVVLYQAWTLSHTS